MPFYLKTDLHHRVKWRKLLPTLNSKASWIPLRTVSHERHLHIFTKETHTIFTGFKVLSESERTAALYTLLEHSNNDQLQFFMTVIQKKVQPPEEPKCTREHALIIWIRNPLKLHCF